MVRSTWAALVDGLSPDDLALFTEYRDFCRALPDVEERVHSAEVEYAIKRIFTSGYMKSHYLEVGVDLLREAKHPQLRTVFPSTKKVFTHRLTMTSSAQLRSIHNLIEEARETVGPGTR